MLIRSTLHFTHTRIIGRRYLSIGKEHIPTITLFQYAICPFCNINKALLGYTGTPYNITEVNPLTKAELKFSTDGYKKVPIATISNEPSDSGLTQINGSEEINQALLSVPSVIKGLSEKNKLSIDIFQNSPSAKQWQTFAKDELAPIIYPNICSSLPESYQAFGYVDHVREFTGMQKIMIKGLGSLAMYFAASKIKQKRNITDEREALRNALKTWKEDGLDNGAKDYGSGSNSPDLGDLAMFGVIHSVKGLNAHDEMILGKGDGHDVDPVVLEWYLRMEEQVVGNKDAK